MFTNFNQKKQTPESKKLKKYYSCHEMQNQKNKSNAETSQKYMNGETCFKLSTKSISMEAMDDKDLQFSKKQYKQQRDFDKISEYSSSSQQNNQKQSSNNFLSKQIDQKKKKKQFRLNAIKVFAKQFHIAHNHASINTRLMKWRTQKRNKLFTYLMYTVEQLREIPFDKLNKNQKQLVSINSQKLYQFIVNLTINIQQTFVRVKNKGYPSITCDLLRIHMVHFLYAMSPDYNLSFKRRVLSCQLTAQILVEMNDDYFFCEQYRKKIQQRRQAYSRYDPPPKYPTIQIYRQRWGD